MYDVIIAIEKSIGIMVGKVSKSWAEKKKKRRVFNIAIYKINNHRIIYIYSKRDTRQNPSVMKINPIYKMVKIVG